MPISTTILSHKYFNQFSNDEDFLSNTSDFTENLAGSAIEAIKVVTQIEISWQAVASQSNPWTFLKNTGTDWTITRANGSFFTDGFWVGAYCRLETTNAFMSNITIDSISNDGKVLNVTADNTTTVSDGVFDFFLLRPIASDASNLLTSLIYGFGIIGENETYNKLSKVSGNKQEYYFTPISGVDVAGKAKGTYNDWVSGYSTCKSIASADAYTQSFEIAHIFRVEPHYLDGDLGNLQDNILPDLFNTNSLKYAFDVEFRIALSNPNKAIKATYESIKGSVGWFNQNFNGFDNDYQIESIVYEDSALTTSTDGLQISSKTKATITVSKLSGALTVGQRAGVFVSYLPTQSEYQNTVTTLQENYLIDSLYHTEGTTAKVGTGIIKSLDSSIVSGDLVIVAEFEYTTAQQLRLTTESNYLLVVQMADSALSAGNSDRVNLIADVQNYQKGTFIEGLFNITDFGYLVNGMTLVESGSPTIAEIWNEDSISAVGSFDLDLANESFLERIEFALVAFNTVTNSYFLLDSYFINTANAIVSGGSQQININQSRGYVQAYEPDVFNTINIAIGSKVGDLQGYTFNFAQKLKWQEWMFNRNADTVFFDSAEPQNNLNFKSSNYSGLNDYQIKVLVLANTTGLNDLGQSGIGRDTYEGGNITVKDYNVSSTSYTVKSISTLDPYTLTNLNGAVLSDRPTLLESRFSTGATPSTGNKLILHRYEKANQLGDVLPEIEATLSVDGTDLVGQTLLSNSLFELGTEYNFTARLFSPFLAFSLTTTWNTGTNGNFTTSINTGAGDILWILPNGETYATDTFVTSDGGLNGTPQKITAVLSDVTLVTALSSFSSKRLFGTLDLSLFTGVTGIISTGSNAGLTEIIYPDSNSNYIFSPSCGLNGELVVKCGASARVSLHTNTSLLSLVFDNDVTLITECALFNLTSLESITLPAVFDISGLGSASFLNGGFSTALVNSVLAQLDASTPATGIGTVINLLGSSAPDGSTGGNDGITAKNNLIAKGYSVATA